jgi:hypothetical protein
MPVARPQYGRKPGPSVVAPDPRLKTAAQTKAEAVRAAAVAAAVMTIVG